jgi:anthranilate/para-aminobenzoate synthase component I
MAIINDIKYQRKQSIWLEPLQFLEIALSSYPANLDFSFLYSGLANIINNSFSYLALFPINKIVTDDFSLVRKTILADDNWWFGYFSYEITSHFEQVNIAKKDSWQGSKIAINQFALIIEFNHQDKLINIHYHQEENYQYFIKIFEQYQHYSQSIQSYSIDEKISAISHYSNFSDDEYLSAIEMIKQNIANGDFYQTNLTRKFYGKISNNANNNNVLQLFLRLNNISAANYTALIKNNDNYIISNSPELFLNIDKDKIFSIPIKGTAPRDCNYYNDQQNLNQLINNPKEIAENLMIVDLVRNDLSRICKIGTIKVDNLFSASSYYNVHHLSSRISGNILDNKNLFDALEVCFPQGSMTGAPKIKAMEAASSFEKLTRGIYSGTISLIKSKREAIFSVVIRTLLLQKDRYEFQVGGGITFDSIAEKELQEIYHKAKSIMEVLGIN